jgi:L-alanine-DL-glutamate epimerase-like enolase superfamily enzyme
MHLAAALPRMDYACELGEFDRLLDDAFEGIEIEDGRLKLPQGPGSGVSLKREDTRPRASAAQSGA